MKTSMTFFFLSLGSVAVIAKNINGDASTKAEKIRELLKFNKFPGTDKKLLDFSKELVDKISTLTYPMTPSNVIRVKIFLAFEKGFKEDDELIKQIQDIIKD